MARFNLPVLLARLTTWLPRGKTRSIRLLCRWFPELRTLPVETRYGRIVCDLWETVCYPLFAYGEYPHWRGDEVYWERLPLNRDSLVLDIGANIGVMTNVFARRAGRVISFEPSPRAMRLLRENAPANAELKQVALSDHTGTARFAEIEALDMSHLSDSGIEVEVARLDQFGLRPDLIKIDVEGYEPEVLAGAVETLKAGPVILFEALDQNQYRRCTEAILAAEPGYTFEQMNRGYNYLAWPPGRDKL